MLHHHRMHVENELVETVTTDDHGVQGDHRGVQGGDSRVGRGPRAATD